MRGEGWGWGWGQSISNPFGTQGGSPAGCVHTDHSYIINIKKKPHIQADSIKGVQASAKWRRHGTQRGRRARVSRRDSSLRADPRMDQGSGVAMANVREKPETGGVGGWGGFKGRPGAESKATFHPAKLREPLSRRGSSMSIRPGSADPNPQPPTPRPCPIPPPPLTSTLDYTQKNISSCLVSSMN